MILEPYVQPVPKPSKEAQSSEDGAKKVLLSDVYATAKTKVFARPWNAQDYSYTIFMLVVHGLCLLAPMTFSWPMVGLFFGSYFITGALPTTLQALSCHEGFLTCCAGVSSACWQAARGAGVTCTAHA